MKYGVDAGAAAMLPPAAETTGRYVVVFADDHPDPGVLLQSVAGLSNLANARDFEGQQVDPAQMDSAGAVVFPDLGVAVVSSDPEQTQAIQAEVATDGAIIAVVPELVHHVLPDVSQGYLQGYRDGVTDLTGRLGAPAGTVTTESAVPPAAPPFQDTALLTWGLQATNVSSSPQSGQGIRVAVLDTGFDLAHPDFVGRQITAQSFVTGQSPQDGHGHGTHCTGTACGPRMPAAGPRYGIAYEAQILVGKVLSNQGSGSDAGILAGINWATANGCDVISMSLGADVAQPSPVYTAVGRRVLDRGTLMVAAAGNNADRRAGNVGFVGIPANSPYIMAVAALEQQLAVTFFSARSLPVRGGQVDVAGPGWRVYSSWPMPARYNTISGTSMATPHAAGIAALWAQATGLRGRQLWATLCMDSQRLAEPSLDVGSGLVLAPQ